MAERAGQADHEDEEELGRDKDINTPGDQHRDNVIVRESTDVEESECPCCQSVGILTLSCGHKLCPTCIELSHGELGQAGCTICYGSQLMDSVLQTLLEALFHGQPRRPAVTPGAVEESVQVAEDGGKAVGGYVGVEKEELCMKHEEVLCVFCLEEGEPLCWQCQMDEHEGHQCCSIQEAVLDCKVRHKHQDTNCTQWNIWAGLHFVLKGCFTY